MISWINWCLITQHLNSARCFLFIHLLPAFESIIDVSDFLLLQDTAHEYHHTLELLRKTPFFGCWPAKPTFVDSFPVSRWWLMNWWIPSSCFFFYYYLKNIGLIRALFCVNMYMLVVHECIELNICMRAAVTWFQAPPLPCILWFDHLNILLCLCVLWVHDNCIEIPTKVLFDVVGFASIHMLGWVGVKLELNSIPIHSNTRGLRPNKA